MNWKISPLFFVLLFIACANEKSTPVSNEYLIEVNELDSLIRVGDISILDFRKKKYYDAGHIPGALHIWRSDIENDSFGYKGMMAEKEQMENLFGELGIDKEDMLVIYDDNGLCDASRLWWLLQYYGFDDVRMLHGGMSGWEASGSLVSTADLSVKESFFEFEKTPSKKHLATKEDVLRAIKNNTLIVDTRTLEEYSGKRQKKGAAKGGRIPTSIRIDWAEAIDYDGDKKIKSLEELRSIYGRMNASPSDSIIVYCHSGVRSAHTTFVLTQLLGYEHVKNYDGSWTEWSHFENLPFERDSVTVVFK